MIQPRIADRRPLLSILIGLVILCWLALFIWGASPYNRYLSHETLEDVRLSASGEYLGFLGIFVAGWTLMTVAMMLPTSLPLVFLFERVVQRRQNRRSLVVLLLLGYLCVWIIFGGVAHLADFGVHMVAQLFRWTETNAGLLAAAPLLLAGAYQFTPLKQLCLKKCRSPFGFITEHWRGANAGAEAFYLGAQHGLYCIGCCWALMLVMFAVGVGSVTWMLVLGTIMAVEKNLPWGRRLSTPTGVALLAAGIIYVSGNLM
jgi:predicted metal-binding membrane protein